MGSFSMLEWEKLRDSIESLLKQGWHVGKMASI